MSLKLLIATRNQKKKQELESILSDLDITLLTMDDFADLPEVIEDGSTFEANAIKKALTVAQKSNCITLADDSGLEVEFLGGAPGTFSARFAGPLADEQANNRKLLTLLQNVNDPQRAARFVCVIALAWPWGRTETVAGICPGKITREPRGEGGFGYDPYFIPTGYSETFAELSPQEKNRISHRGQALEKAKALLRDQLKTEEND